MVVALSVALSAFQVAVTWLRPVTPLLHYAVFLSATLCLLFLVQAESLSAADDSSKRRTARLWALVSAAVGLWFVIRFPWIADRWPLVDPLSLLDLACGFLFLAAVFEATRRTVGMVLVVVMAVFLAYALFGHLAGGLFYHRPLTLAEVIDHLVFTGNGLFGAPVAVAASYVYVFILFGTALELSGGGDFLFKVAGALTGRTKGGPAKVAVVSSGLYGSITGSPTANVMTTGPFTIPMMKRSGIKGEVAGAIESVASTGGALLPPVMGSASFLMAELTGIDYIDILVAAVVPALLFYLGVFAQVHFGAIRIDAEGVEEARSPLVQTLKQGGHHFIPVVVLVVLLVMGWSPISAAGVGLVVAVAVSWRHAHERIGLARMLEVLELTAKRSLVVTTACAAAGVVVGAIVTTGLGGKITGLIFAFAQGSLPFALVATMVVCVILGMGMPVPSAYIVTAVLAGPGLALMGLSTMSAHLFILYFATLSAVTPPVAVSAYAAAGIAEADPNRTALQATRLGAIAFVIPYFFVYHPELLLVGTPAMILLTVLTSAIGVVLVAGALEGHMRVAMAPLERWLVLVGGVALLLPGLSTDLIGAVVALFVARRQLAGAPRPRKAVS